LPAYVRHRKAATTKTSRPLALSLRFAQCTVAETVDGSRVPSSR
jgi:hypothetical protein